jgi:hypothetical protein
MIAITPDEAAEPLQTVCARSENAHMLRIYDGMGRMYAQSPGPEARFVVSGALGHHVIAAFDAEGQELERISLRVDCESDIEDKGGRYCHLLRQCLTRCLQDIHKGGKQGANVHNLDERIRRGFVLTSRDHIHGHKAMRYFLDWNREWIDAFCEYQREDGMVWDFLAHRPERERVHFEWRWGKEFYRVVANGDSVFARQPVMNDLEHMFIRGIWQTWRTTDDDEWMKNRLDNALKALEYATTSPYMWSEKFGLVHRPFCIDMWDFQSKYDAALFGGDIMMARPGVSRYGAMHGDSMGLAQACDELTEMLEHAARKEDAERVKRIGRSLRENLDKYCWNGEFFTHFVPEDPTFERDFGVDQSKQVSLSNAYALNRGIPHEQAVAIIKTYQRLRAETKDIAPAEWFCMYPPFFKGFGEHSTWHYVNGGVSPMVAGELAHGAFEHGFEQYGVDIIDRVAELGVKYDRIPGVWRGLLPRTPERDFDTLDLRGKANMSLSSTPEGDAIPWSKEPGNDLAQMPTGKREFETVPFDVIDPGQNKGASCIGISAKEPYAASLEIPIGRKAASIYFLHTLSGGSLLAGDLTIHYSDGTTHRMYVRKGEHIQSWHAPRQGEPETRPDPMMLVAWRGANAKSPDVGVMVWGFNNPHPDKDIERLVLNPSIDGAVWVVLGVTLSDQPVYLTSSGLSRGIPTPWSVGAVIWAMFEGLSGVYDAEPNFKTARICPRWAASDATQVTVTAKFEEGGGYVRYKYWREGDTLLLQVTSSGTRRCLEILLPEGTKATGVKVNGEERAFGVKQIGHSTYTAFDTEGIAVKDVRVEVS